jgi:hypothetical protein
VHAGQRGGDAGRGGRDPGGQLVDAAADELVAAGGAEGQQADAVGDEPGEADVVAADAQRDQVGVRVQRAELRRVGASN